MDDGGKLTHAHVPFRARNIAPREAKRLDRSGGDSASASRPRRRCRSQVGLPWLSARELQPRLERHRTKRRIMKLTKALLGSVVGAGLMSVIMATARGMCMEVNLEQMLGRIGSRTS